MSVGVRWGVGGAVAQKFAQEGFFVVLTTRTAANASALAAAIREQGGGCVVTIICDRGDRYFAPMKWERRYTW